jgi:hypothetical protein
LTAQGKVTAALVAVIALAEGRGLIPLGVGIGFLPSGGPSPNDGRVAGVEHPFGASSSMLPDGTVGVSMAPRHGGLEGSRLVLIALALDPDSLGASDLPSRRVSALVRWVDRVGAAESIPGPFPVLPQGTLDLGARRLDLGGANESTWTALSVELRSTTLSWRIYAPGIGSGQRIDLSKVLPERSQLGGEATAVGAGMRGPLEYSDLWTFGSSRGVDRAIEQTEAFAIEPCASAGSRCTLR